uniref:Uncharacterized protein n=1 Tax=Rhizophora mucronata TaxID=61149 RepID=A0A2P2QJL2_RHIMU
MPCLSSQRVQRAAAELQFYLLISLF